MALATVTEYANENNTRSRIFHGQTFMELAKATVVVRGKNLLIHVRIRRQFDVVQLACLHILDNRLDRSIEQAKSADEPSRA